MVDTSYTNNGGTGDRTADITVTSNMFGAGDPNLLVDGDISVVGLPMTPGVGDGYIKFDFGSGADPVIDAFRYYIRTHVHAMNLGVWLFEGSDDDSSWTNLSSVGGLWFFNTGEEFVIAVFEVTGFQNTTGYRYFRMSQAKSSVPPSSPELLEVEFRINGSASDPDPPPPPDPDPDYGEPGGTGDRRSLIWVSENFEAYQQRGNAVNLINGVIDDNSTDAFQFNGAFIQYAAEIIFDFAPSGYKQLITAFKWYQDIVFDIGIWAFEGSDNERVGWVTLLDTIDLGADTDAEHTFSNDTAYRFYRLRKTDTSDEDVALNIGAWMEEIEFKIARRAAIVEALPAWQTAGMDVTLTVGGTMTIGSAGLAVANTEWFDGDTSSGTTQLGLAFPAGSPSLDFEFVNPQVVNAIRWYQANNTPERWFRAYGSHDGSAWQSIGRAGVKLADEDVYNPFEFNGFAGNTKAFKHYRLLLTDGLSVFGANIFECQFRALEKLPDPAQLCLSYNNDFGKGDRTATDLVVTLDVGTLDAGTLDSLIDGVRDGTTLYANIDNDADWKLKFDFGTAVNIRQATMMYQVGTFGDGTGHIQWEASNDDSTWVDVSSVLDPTAADEFVNDLALGVFRYSAPLIYNDSYFRYYRMKRIDGGGEFKFSEMEFYISGGSAGTPFGTYSYQQSSGDRTLGPPTGIGVTLTGTLTNGTIDNLIDGTAAENDTYGVKFTDGQTGVIIKFDFGDKVFIDQTKFSGFTPGADYHGAHYFEGSNDDFVSDINVVQDPWHGGVGFTGTSVQDLDSPGAYRWYRIRQKSGAWQNAIYVNEFYFRMFPQLSVGECAGDPPPVYNPIVSFTDEDGFIVGGSDFVAHFTDESEFDAEITTDEPAPPFSADFTDDEGLSADVTLTSPPINPVVIFSDDDGLLAREEHEPVAIVQSLIIISGR